MLRPYNHRRHLPAVALGLCLAAAGSAVHAAEYAVTNLSFGGSTTTYMPGPKGLNEAGQVVGSIYDRTRGSYHAFVYDGTTLRDLGTLGGAYSSAVAINAGGQVAGYGATVAGQTHAFRYDGDGSSLVDLGTLGGSSSGASDINGAGQVIGTSYRATSVNSGMFRHDGPGTSMTDIGGESGSHAAAINDAGQVTGRDDFSERFDQYPYRNVRKHAFRLDGPDAQKVDLGAIGERYDSGGMLTSVSYAVDINESGQVMGVSNDANGHGHAFRHDGGEEPMVDLGTLGGYTSRPLDINERGQVVGLSHVAPGSGALRAFRHDGGGSAMVDLDTLGGRYSVANAINDAGHVVGTAADSFDRSRAFLHEGDGGMIDLNERIDPALGLVLHSALAISNGGLIVASSNTGLILLSPSTAVPSLGPIALDAEAVAIGTEVRSSVNFTDEDPADAHSAEWDWGDGDPPTAGQVTESDGAGAITGSHVYGAAGIYPLTVTVTDASGLSATVSRDVVVYDPTAGFVTGGGWIESPPGAYRGDEQAIGRATFGFVSKYKKGATVPSGTTRFHFQAADLAFFSDDYDWLVVTGATAKYKGRGTINGEGGFRFMLNAVDGALLGQGNDGDRFRIKIWRYEPESESDVIVYDNQLDSADEDTTNEGTLIGGGSIVVHKGRGGRS